MPQLDAQLGPALAAALQAARGELTAALSRGCDVPFEVAAIQPATTLDRAAVPTTLQTAGVVVVVRIGSQGLGMFLSAAPQTLPAWIASPSVAEKQRLATLAQEMSALALPAELSTSGSAAGYVGGLDDALAAGNPANDAQQITVELTGNGQPAALTLIWPLNSPEAIDLSQPAPPTSESESSAPSQPQPVTSGAVPLPPYTRSLLKIRVPVHVTLASKRQSISRILDLGPGSIIQFNKSCEDMLTLEVGGECVAEGEPVKVGDKFGLRINSVVVPKEHFKPIDAVRTRRGSSR